MKKLFSLATAALFVGSMMAASPAPQQEKPSNAPEVGTWSIGFTFNPVSLGSQIAVQPKAGTTAKDFVGEPNKRQQLFILSQDPLAAIRTKFHATEHLNVRLSLGLNGSHISYNEYVIDDLSRALNPLSENKVIDRVHSDMNATNLGFGLEYVAGGRNLKFVMGANLLYAIAGGKVTYEYGNLITAENPVPSHMPLSGTLNPNPAAGAAQGIVAARPLETKTTGMNQGLGFQLDMGIEWFFVKNLSLGASVTFTPVMFVFQPQTYARYEGFSTVSNRVEQYNDLYSPDGWACLYGTQNLGLQISLNYYFGK